MNCKAGDLAIIVRDPICCGANVGRIVEVLTATPRGEWEHPDYPEWYCKATGTIVWSQIGSDGRISHGDIADELLRPIHPGELDDETPTEIIRELETQS